MTATADLYDERGAALASLPVQLRDFGGVRAFSGPVRTVRCYEDNALVKTLTQTPGDGANPRKSSKTGAGVVDEQVEIGGIVFRPGATVYADEDGVLVER
jgi:regulator of ribonuclease activity A